MLLKFANLDLENPNEEEEAYTIISYIFQKTIALKENTLFVCGKELALIPTIYENLKGAHVKEHDDYHLTFDNGSTVYVYNLNDNSFIPPSDNTVFLGCSHMEDLTPEHINNIDSYIFDRDKHVVFIIDDMKGENNCIKELAMNLLCGARGWIGLWWKIKRFFKKLFRKK